jgi:hypothetical protein
VFHPQEGVPRYDQSNFTGRFRHFLECATFRLPTAEDASSVSSHASAFLLFLSFFLF